MCVFVCAHVFTIVLAVEVYLIGIPWRKWIIVEFSYCLPLLPLSEHTLTNSGEIFFNGVYMLNLVDVFYFKMRTFCIGVYTYLNYITTCRRGLISFIFKCLLTELGNYLNRD